MTTPDVIGSAFVIEVPIEALEHLIYGAATDHELVPGELRDSTHRAIHDAMLAVNTARPGRYAVDLVELYKVRP